MKAFDLHRYGPPDLLELTDTDKPVPADDEVLVRVRATSVNPYDWHNMRGEPYLARLMPGGLGLRGPKLRILGCDMAGQVEAAGRDVTQFRPAEYVAVRESLLAPKPKNLSYEKAAAVPMAAVTALLGLRDAGQLQPGQKVLVNGASGGVGTFAVQIARALGAKVAGVCGPQNVDLVASIGADEIIDYSTEDFTRNGQRYDLVLDVAGTRSVVACRRALTAKGTFVSVGGPAGRWLQPAGHIFSALAVAPLASQTMATVDTPGCTEKKQNLVTLTRLIEDGKITPAIDRSYPFGQIPAAIRYQE